MHPAHTSSKTVWTLVFVTAIAFFLLSIAFIPVIGIQNDESIFATVIYGPIAREFRLRAFHHDLPLMIMTYLGAFKSWIYAGLFSISTPNLWSLRFPMVLLGTVTIGVFSLLLSKASKLRFAALFGSILLAFDPSYLLTTVFDWGPVVFQHLLLVSGTFLMLRFVHSGNEKSLAGGFFCLGLGLWDKALLSWSLIGFGAAVLIVFYRELWKLLNRRNIAIAVIAFVAGSAPLVLYNARNKLKTFRSNAKLDWSEVVPKWVQVRSTLDGSALFGYLVREEWEEKSAPVPEGLPKLSLDLRTAVGERRFGWGYLAFLLCAAAVPLWWRERRLMFFSLIYLTVAWLMMAATHDAGGSAHHVVLLWPFPQLVVGIALACLAERGKWGITTAGLLLGIICSQNLLVLNQYYTQATHFCGGTVWTDAMDPLHRSLVARRPAAVNILGWGMEFTLTMLEKGKLPLRYAATHVGEETPNQSDREAIQAILNEEGGIFVAHTAELEIQPGIAKRFDKAAASLGYRREMLEVIQDRCGRPTFEIFRFVKAQ